MGWLVGKILAQLFHVALLDSAQRFLTQAHEAVTANNLLLAESSAEKAETLADGLR